MLKPSNLVFKQIRNMKRNTTVMSHSTSKDLINSAKDIKNARSHKQIDIANFMENKNDKIKNIDEKLQVHQSQINRNNSIIEELNSNFMNLKDQLDKEKQNTANEERKNRLLREEIQRTNKLLRVKNSKIQDCSKKLIQLEKDNQSFKGIAGKYDENTKTISNLRSKIVHHEETISDLKSSIAEKDRELHRQKDKIANYELLRARQQDLNGQILMKDVTIGNLKQTINELHQQKLKEISQKNIFEKQVDKLNEQIQKWRAKQAKLNTIIHNMQQKQRQIKEKYQLLESELKSQDCKLKQKQKEESQRKKVYHQIKQKLNKVQDDYQEATRQLSKKDTKIEKLTQKIKELENNYGDTMKEKEKIKVMEQKLGNLKRKGQSLKSTYYSIVPQIQCPFGHELQNPVTIIPCGHNYCLGCKKGYIKDCMQCSGKLKIDAVYRNELMDDIIGMVGGIKQVMELLK